MLRATTQGTPSIDIETSRIQTGPLSGMAKPIFSSARGWPIVSLSTVKSSPPSPRKPCVNGPDRLSQCFCRGWASGKGRVRQPNASNVAVHKVIARYYRKLMEKVRISKLMAHQGLCSRREADAFLAAGLVTVDGQPVGVGDKAMPGQSIVLNKKGQRQQQSSVTILIHKPIGIVSGQAEAGYVPAVSLVTAATQSRTDRTGRAFKPSHLRGLAVAGRLDIDSTGLLVLTADGRIARQLISEDSEIEKEYLVRVQGRLAESGLHRLRHGLSLDGKPLKPAVVEWQNDDQLRFVLREGKKRQIRRMCELVGLRVAGLKRVSIGRVKLADLPVGQWRFLGNHERF